MPNCLVFVKLTLGHFEDVLHIAKLKTYDEAGAFGDNYEIFLVLDPYFPARAKKAQNLLN